jgi:hypothetical protein
MDNPEKLSVLTYYCLFFFAFGSSVRLLEYLFGILGILHSWFIKHLSLYYLQFDDHCNLIVVTTNADIPTTSNGQQTDSTTTMLTTHEKTTDQIEKTERRMKNGQSGETFRIEYTRHKQKTNNTHN